MSLEASLNAHVEMPSNFQASRDWKPLQGMKILSDVFKKDLPGSVSESVQVCDVRNLHAFDAEDVSFIPSIQLGISGMSYLAGLRECHCKVYPSDQSLKCRGP